MHILPCNTWCYTHCPSSGIRILYVGMSHVNFFMGKPTYIMRWFAHMDYTWANPRTLCVGLPTWIIHGQTHAFYTWVCPSIICVGKPMHIMHGQTHHGQSYQHPTFIMRGFAHAYYTWAKPHKIYVGCKWGCPCPTLHYVPRKSHVNPTWALRGT